MGLALLTSSVGKLKCKCSFIFQTETCSHVPATSPRKCEIFASEALDPNKEFKSCLCWKYFVIVTREHFNNWLGCWLASGLREKKSEANCWCHSLPNDKDQPRARLGAKVCMHIVSSFGQGTVHQLYIIKSVSFILPLEKEKKKKTESKIM